MRSFVQGKTVAGGMMAGLAAAAVLAFVAPAAAAAGTVAPTDLTGHWAKAAVEAGVGAGYINGYPDGTFRPDQTITRAEFTKLLTAAMRIRPEFPTEIPFDDTNHWVFQGGYAQAAIADWLVVPADYGKLFSPDTPISRREIAVAASRALGGRTTPAANVPELTTPDAKSMPDWLYKTAAFVKWEGVLTGYPDGTLGLDKTATRAEALVMLQRVIARLDTDVAPLPAVPKADNAARYPGDSEPFWTWKWTGSIRAGATAYPLPGDTSEVKVLPTAGATAWVTYLDNTNNQGVIGRLAGGKLTVVHREPGRNIYTPVAADSQGRLWYHLWGALSLIETDGTGPTFPGLTIRDEAAPHVLDDQGNLVFISGDTVVRAHPDGQVETVFKGVQAINTQKVLPGANSAVWLVGGTQRTEAVRINAEGKIDLVEVLSLRQLLYEGTNGTTAWFGGWDAAYRWDLLTGHFTRAVLPAAVPDHFSVTPGPEGTGSVSTDAGAFWRLVP